MTQNAAARVVTRCDRRKNMSSVLESLHWLPVIKRIKFKSLVIIHNSIHGTAPPYLCELIPPITCNNNYNLRSNNSQVLSSSKTVNSFGDRNFSAMSSELWNPLPQYLKNERNTIKFKKLLKTYLFSL